MHRVLVVFGTTDGHTAKVARFLAAELQAVGGRVDVFAAAGGPEACGPDAYSGIVVAASVHARGYQRAVSRWVRRYARALQPKPTAFLSVCLGVLQDDAGVQRDLARILDVFFTRTGWRPHTVKMLAGALPYTRYGFLKRWAMRRIARKAGGGTDVSRDYEYTDWNDLRAFVKDFYASLNATDTARSPDQVATGLTRP